MREVRRSERKQEAAATQVRGVTKPSPLDNHKRSMITLLRRIEGQLRGIQGLIEQDASCEAIAQQVAAARRALERAFYEMVACSMEAEFNSAESLKEAKVAAAHVTRILAKYG